MAFVNKSKRLAGLRDAGGKELAAKVAWAVDTAVQERNKLKG